MQGSTQRWSEQYSIDPFGNLTSFGSHGVAAQVLPGTNRLQQFAYDASGNMTQGPTGSSIKYDGENRIFQNGNLIFQYDGDGMLAWEGYNGDPDPGDGKYYFRDLEGQVIEDAGSCCNFGNNDYFGSMLIHRGQDMDDFYPIPDSLGSNTTNFDENGVPSTDELYPYGQEVNVVAGNVFKFTGKERDSESGLDYFGARYYASSLGRFMSPDWAAKAEPVPYAKLDNPQSLNLYAYVSNNPLRMADKDGHEGDPCGGAKNCTSTVDTKHQTATTTVTQTSKPVTTQNSDGSSVTRTTTTSTSVTVSTADANKGQVLGGSQTQTTTSTYTNQLGGSITETSNPMTQNLSPQQVQNDRPNQLGALEKGIAPSAMQNIQKHPFTAGASGVGLAGGVITGVACAVGEPCGAIVLTGAGLAALGGALGLYGVATQK